MDVVIYQTRHEGATIRIDHLIATGTDLTGGDFLDLAFRQQHVGAILEFRVMTVEYMRVFYEDGFGVHLCYLCSLFQQFEVVECLRVDRVFLAQFRTQGGQAGLQFLRLNIPVRCIAAQEQLGSFFCIIQ